MIGKRLFAILVTCLLATGLTGLCRAQDMPEVVNKPAKHKPQPGRKIYSESADAKEEIIETLAKAAAAHKRVIIVFGANWCFDCHVLDKAFHKPDLAAIIAANYEVVHIDVGEFDKNLDLMEKYDVPRKKGIPGLAVLDPDGKLVYSQKNGEFENARGLGETDFREFLEKWKPAAKS